MKTMMTVTIEVAIHDALRSKAIQEGYTVSGLVQAFVNYGMHHMPEEILRASMQRPERFRGSLTKNERLALDSIETMMRVGKGDVWRFSAQDIARESGLKLTAAFLALRLLAKRGKVKGFELPEVDRWGRPVESYWRLADVERREDAVEWLAKQPAQAEI